MDPSLLERKNCSNRNVATYIWENFPEYLEIYSDASKMEDGRVGVAFVIPDFGVRVSKRTSDNVAVYTGELLALLLAMVWVEESASVGAKIVIASDCSGALTSVKCMESVSRQDIIFEIVNIMNRVNRSGKQVVLLWVPAHIGIQGNEMADKYAKQGARSRDLNFPVKISKEEVKSIVKAKIKELWQRSWEEERKGRFYFSIQRRVGESITGSEVSRREEDVITRLRFGHTYLNSSLYLMRKHQTGQCEYCGERETVEHIFMQCVKYRRHREELKAYMSKSGMGYSVKTMLRGCSSAGIVKAIMRFLRGTRLFLRI